MAKVKALIMTGYGINCDAETKFAFELAGGEAEIIHINDLIKNKSLIKQFRIIAFPGGFSYGDDTGSGKAYANKIRNNLSEEFSEFVSGDNLVIGICNGFQIISNIGIVPGYSKLGEGDVALEHNNHGRYECGWVDLNVSENNSVFLRGIKSLHVPFAHGEGNFYAEESVMKRLVENKQDALRYSKNGSPAKGEYPFNPNGAMDDIAGITDVSGRILGMMPHPERYLYFCQREDWTYQKEMLEREGKKVPEYGEGLKIFQNAVEYFQ
ncbi:MAG TPA: phosphoribosylformylglycinamidine synthase subunit PurQ [Spirochaetota bacterium]|nr:phosphoribosylformylglycinamidine synthase subunit PurQ [Spirochaetota bacterium]HOR45217.1 phosphoribosylformylglycinamidine synthase subunit PurQ [Spirochaetota bacterium]HPK56822.1 phosphoribosylformylglycinamidine synthase subunit PurQ [Spirochaetota bacterium]